MKILYAHIYIFREIPLKYVVSTTVGYSFVGAGLQPGTYVSSVQDVLAVKLVRYLNLRNYDSIYKIEPTLCAAADQKLNYPLIHTDRTRIFN